MTCVSGVYRGVLRILQYLDLDTSPSGEFPLYTSSNGWQWIADMTCHMKLRHESKIGAYEESGTAKVIRIKRLEDVRVLH